MPWAGSLVDMLTLVGAVGSLLEMLDTGTSAALVGPGLTMTEEVPLGVLSWMLLGTMGVLAFDPVIEHPVFATISAGQSTVS